MTRPAKEHPVMAMLTPEGKEARRCSVCGAESVRPGDRKWSRGKPECADGCRVTPIEAPK